MLVTEPKKIYKPNIFILELEKKFDMGIKGLRKLEETKDPSLQKKKFSV